MSLRIGVITAMFNEEVTLKLEAGALDTLHAHGLKENDIVSVRVPGAFEIPLIVKKMLGDLQLDGVIALGAVIRGETTHYDYVCSAVERGCSALALEFTKPVGFGVLTTEDEDQAMARAGGAHGNKGIDTANAVVEMCKLLKALGNKVLKLDAVGQAGYNV